MAVISYKCPHCGGPLTWNAEKQTYFCEYCSTETSEEELKRLNPEKASETELSSEEAEAMGLAPSEKPEASTAGQASAKPEGHGADGQTDGNTSGGKRPAKITLYSCPSCGAQIMTDATTAATSCYYCHTPVVLADRLDGAETPDLVVPFEISREKAKEIFAGWVAQHKYVPCWFFSEKQIELMNGVYFPYWVYSCETNGHAAGEGRKLKTWMVGDMQHTETSVYHFDKSGRMKVQNVTRVALKKASKVLVESVMPFELSKGKTFSEGYLQGFQAEARDIERNELQREMTEEVKNYAAEQLSAAAGGDYSSVSFTDRRVEIESESWKYALLPVYTMTYKDKKTGKVYYFSINGQSGKTCGELPVQNSRVIRLFFLIAVPVLAALLLLFYFVF